MHLSRSLLFCLFIHQERKVIKEKSSADTKHLLHICRRLQRCCCCCFSVVIIKLLLKWDPSFFIYPKPFACNNDFGGSMKLMNTIKNKPYTINLQIQKKSMIGITKRKNYIIIHI